MEAPGVPVPDLSVSRVPPLIGDDSLEKMLLIGKGGFGDIYRVRHKNWGMDVAIKLLDHKNNSSSDLQREAALMQHGTNPNVLNFLGVYQGTMFRPGCPVCWGLVMEYMCRGSLWQLQRSWGDLRPRPLPWPLSVRVVHQVALGMNFLHQLSPPLLHLDLKPQNVLLDDSLNAKITDFGLSKLAPSVSSSSGVGGTTRYMPPEALDESARYTPKFSSDVYSYGILLWSVMTGLEPYHSADSSLVKFRIGQQDRPDISQVDSNRVDTRLTDLMKQCWDHDPEKRPSFRGCVEVTEKVHDLHKLHVHDEVTKVLNLLDEEKKLSSQMQSLSLSSKPCTDRPSSCSVKMIVQEMAKSSKSNIKGDVNARPTAAPGFRYTAAREPTNHGPPITQRQNSSPASTRIVLSNVQGVQIGNNNTMNITQAARRERGRERNPSAPSTGWATNSPQPRQ